MPVSFFRRPIHQSSNALMCVVFRNTLRIKLRLAPDGCTPIGLQVWAGISTANFEIGEVVDLTKTAQVDYSELEMVEEPGPEFAYDESFLQGESWTSSLEEHIAAADWGRPRWRRSYGNYRGYGRYGRYGNHGNVGTSTSPAATTTASPDSSTVPSSTVTTSAVAADCECPTLPSFVRFQGGLEDVFVGSLNISGVHEIRQFHEDGTEAANGRILAIITTGDLDERLRTQPQHMVCLCLPNYRIHCVNQMTNAWTLGTFQGVEESTCTPGLSARGPFPGYVSDHVWAGRCGSGGSTWA
ncbi:unnamed protein product [Symbiodinium sp. CCMP2592]|nr:unnamed protein product [Symbiodinium sp. CCMP2592]